MLYVVINHSWWQNKKLSLLASGMKVKLYTDAEISPIMRYQSRKKIDATIYNNVKKNQIKFFILNLEYKMKE